MPHNFPQSFNKCVYLSHLENPFLDPTSYYNYHPILIKPIATNVSLLIFSLPHSNLSSYSITKLKFHSSRSPMTSVFQILQNSSHLPILILFDLSVSDETVAHSFFLEIFLLLGFLNIILSWFSYSCHFFSFSGAGSSPSPQILYVGDRQGSIFGSIPYMYLHSSCPTPNTRFIYLIAYLSFQV